MILIVGLLFLVYFLVISVVDIKMRAIPSVFMTLGIFLALVLNPSSLIFGVLAFVSGWALSDIDERLGVADIKALTILGLLVSSMNSFLIMLGVFAMMQFFYTVVLRKFLKIKGLFPLIPVFLIVYAIIWIAGVI